MSLSAIASLVREDSLTVRQLLDLRDRYLELFAQDPAVRRAFNNELQHAYATQQTSYRVELSTQCLDEVAEVTPEMVRLLSARIQQQADAQLFDVITAQPAPRRKRAVWLGEGPVP